MNKESLETLLFKIRNDVKIQIYLISYFYIYFYISFDNH